MEAKHLRSMTKQVMTMYLAALIQGLILLLCALFPSEHIKIPLFVCAFPLVLSCVILGTVRPYRIIQALREGQETKRGMEEINRRS